MAVISSCIALFNALCNWSNFTGIVFFLPERPSGRPVSYIAPFRDEPFFAWLAIMNILGFVFGLVAALLTKYMEAWTLTIIAGVILLLSHVLSTTLSVYVYPHYFTGWGVTVGGPAILTSALSLTLMVKNRKEFI